MIKKLASWQLLPFNHTINTLKYFDHKHMWITVIMNGGLASSTFLEYLRSSARGQEFQNRYYHCRAKMIMRFSTKGDVTILTHFCLDQHSQNGTFSWWETSELWYDFCCALLHGFYWWQVSICSDNGLPPNRLRAIILIMQIPIPGKTASILRWALGSDSI